MQLPRAKKKLPILNLEMMKILKGKDLSFKNLKTGFLEKRNQLKKKLLL